MLSMNVPYAPMRFFEIARFGLVELVGQFSTSAVSRNGLRMRYLLWHEVKNRAGICRPQDNGAVQAATFPRTQCQLRSPAGAKRKLTHVLLADYHHSHVVKRAQDHILNPKAALTLTMAHVTQGLVPLVHIWALHKLAFVERSKSLDDVWILITIMAGLAQPSAVNSCHVAFIIVNDPATKVSVELAKFELTPVAIVAK